LPRSRAKWDEVIHDLRTLLETEFSFDDNDKKLTIELVFNHFIELYFRYIMIHPQKRDDVKEIMVFIVCRIIDLRHQIVKWNPSCIDVTKGSKLDDIHPWEYFDMHEYFSRFKLRPNNFETHIPSFFKDDDVQRRNERNALAEGYMQLKHNVKSFPLEDSHCDLQKEEPNTILELGPQGKTHVVYDEAFTECTRKRNKSATMIQKVFRGYSLRSEMLNVYEKERIFIGMAVNHEDVAYDKLKRHVHDLYQQRKLGQKETDEEYREALVFLRTLVKKDIEFDLKQSLMKERVEWVTDQISRTNVIPEDLDGFYKCRREAVTHLETSISSDLEEKQTANILSSESKIDRPRNILSQIREKVAQYSEVWSSNMEMGQVNYSKCKFDEDIAKKAILQNELYGEAVKAVENSLLTNLRRIKGLHDPTSVKGTTKKGKDKKKKGKSSKSKGKGKSLPGEKIPSLKSMDTAHMLSVLIENKLVNNVDDRHIHDLIGCELPTSCNPSGNSKPVSKHCVNYSYTILLRPSQ
jgi:hypothetical protein